MVRAGRRRIAAIAAGALTLAVAVTPAIAGARPGTSQVETVREVAYMAQVNLSLDGDRPGSSYAVRGGRYVTGRRVSTVVLLLHGLGFDRYVWDFPTARSSPGSPYSLARFLAAQGVDVVAIDQLGYGSSDHPVGWDARQLTVPAYAGIAHQVVQDLRRSYAHVVVIGHSVGAEITGYEAGRYHDVDAIADLDMCDVGASLEAAHDLLVNDFAGMPDDYGYFGGTPAERLRIMYDMKDADPAVAAQDNRMAPLSPESEMQSASLQPSRHLDQLINVPVFVGFGTADALFPAWCQEAQPALYVRSPLVTRFELAGAGHAIMLHRNAGQLENALERWIARSVPGAIPGG